MLVSVAGPHRQLVHVFGFPVEGVDQAEDSRGLVEEEVPVVAFDQSVLQLANGVGIVGFHRRHGLTGTQVLGDGEVQRGILEGGRAVVLVQDGNLDLERSR